MLNVGISGPGRVAWKEGHVAPCCGVSVSVNLVSVSVWVGICWLMQVFLTPVKLTASPLPRQSLRTP